jgi:hypothetical protein
MTLRPVSGWAIVTRLTDVLRAQLDFLFLYEFARIDPPNVVLIISQASAQALSDQVAPIPRNSDPLVTAIAYPLASQFLLGK